MEIVLAAAAGFVLDLILGDPAWMPHPVVYMGKAISYLEGRLRAAFPQNSRGELAGGLCMAILLPVLTLVLSAAVIIICSRIHPALAFAAQVIWSWQVLAMKGLRDESMGVYDRLLHGTLPEARTAVSRIVGRDTRDLSHEGVTKAAVETVAENFSDGEIAPLFWLLIGGAPLALAYKAVNTMDSMLGYKNEKYLYFGRCAAKLDDLVNYIPARLSALLLILSAGLCRLDMAGAWRIWRRDRHKHASPNSAQTEAVTAGALDVQLAGPAWYFGEYYDKPTIGDPVRPIEAEDIRRANRMNYAAGILGLVLMAGIRCLICRAAGLF